MPGLQNLNNLSPLGNDQINSDWMSELTSDFSLIGESQESPILDSLRYHDFANDLTSPPSKLYETYSYDPRTQRARDVINKNGYVGTRMINVGLVGDGEDGIGGIFNKVTNTASNANKYSTVFGQVNSPGFNQIIIGGNLKDYGEGYPEKQTSVLQFQSTNDVPLQRYFEQGASDPNMEANWFYGGVQSNPVGGSVYPSFDPLAQGFTGYNNTTTPGVGSRTITINASDVKPNQLKDTSWESLYEPFHTSKGVGYSYGPNVSSDNLTLNYTPKHMAPNNFLFGPSSGDQPYVISKIGGATTAEGDFQTNLGIGGRASREIPLMRSLIDVARLGKFMISSKGISFIVKQNLLGKIGGQKHKWAYIPVSTLAAVLRAVGTAPQILNDRTFPFDGDLNPKYEKSYKSIDKTKSLARTPIAKRQGRTGDTITGENNVQKSFTDEEGVGYHEAAFGSDAKKDGGRFGYPFGNMDDLDTELAKIETERYGYPMYFKDLRTNQAITLRAFLEGLTENIAPAWNSEKYIGRSEPVYMYEMAERDISFTLKMFAMSMNELKAIYQKLNKLTSLCYPFYRYDQSLPNLNKDMTYYDIETELDKPVPKVRGVPPLTKFRLGELFGSQKKEVTGFIKSLSYSYPDQSPWEHRRGRRVPKHIVAAITYQVIHDSVPSWFQTAEKFGETFYGINQPEVKATGNVPASYGVGTGDEGVKKT